MTGRKNSRLRGTAVLNCFFGRFGFWALVQVFYSRATPIIVLRNAYVNGIFDLFVSVEKYSILANIGIEIRTHYYYARK